VGAGFKKEEKMTSTILSGKHRPITWRDLLNHLPEDVLDEPLAMHSGARDRESDTLDTVYCVSAVVIDKPAANGPTVIEFYSRDEKVSIIAGASEYVLQKS
jgi:hypothetical protein